MFLGHEKKQTLIGLSSLPTILHPDTSSPMSYLKAFNFSPVRQQNQYLHQFTMEPFENFLSTFIYDFFYDENFIIAIHHPVASFPFCGTLFLHFSVSLTCTFNVTVVSLMNISGFSQRPVTMVTSQC